MTEICNIEDAGEPCDGFSEYLVEPLEGAVPCVLRACGDPDHLQKAIHEVQNQTGYPAVVTAVVCGY